MSPMDRTALLRRASSPADLIMEIGAGYNPIAPKRGGWRTHVVDHTNRTGLCEKYRSADVDTDLIEEVDTIWQDGLLDEVVSAKLIGSVDTIIASHVLEHIPNLVGFLRSADRLVAPEGVLSIALPDRRYCFDCFRPWTTTGSLLDAFQRGATRHGIRVAYDHMAYSAVCDGRLGWGPYAVTAPRLLDDFAAAAAVAAAHLSGASAGYQDYHGWQFSPAGFQLVLLELRALGLINWWIESIEGPENFEFFACLRHSKQQPLPDGEALLSRRQELLLRQIQEIREQAEFLLGAEPHHAAESTIPARRGLWEPFRGLRKIRRWQAAKENS